MPSPWLRHGPHQVCFGWLAYTGTYWPAGELALHQNDVLFPRRESFIHLPGTA